VFGLTTLVVVKFLGSSLHVLASVACQNCSATNRQTRGGDVYVNSLHTNIFLKKKLEL